MMHPIAPVHFSARALCLAAVIAAAAGAAAAQRQAEPIAAGEFTRLNPIPALAPDLPVMHFTVPGVARRPDEAGEFPPMRGICPDMISSHTNANFEGGQFVIQAGFAETEIAAAQYFIPAASFPIKIELMECIFAGQLSVQTTTQWSILVWDGPPSTGTLVASYSSDGVILQPIVQGPGTVGTNVQVSVDPGDPEQIFIFNDSGTNSFTIGYRIDEHHNQTQNPCVSAPPSNSNTFPTTDVGGLQQPARNWLFGVNCGPFGCPANGGWTTFAALPGFCRPSGDWVMRATWSSVNCVPPPEGSCCAPNGSCSVTTQANCTGGGVWTESADCNPNDCAQPTGRCCLPSGQCQILLETDCTAQQGAWTFGQTCAAACPQPTGACCFGNSCQVLEVGTCSGFGGTFIANGAACGPGDTCPLGACCLANGTCVTGQSNPACLMQGGTFQGVGSTCSPNNCPQPTGACCNTVNGFCALLTQAACTPIPNTTWLGPLTTCPPAPCNQPQTGACCTGGICSLTTAANCTGPNSSFAGNGTTCNEPGNNTDPCCRADFNQDGDVGVPDIFAFLAAWFAADESADFDLSGGDPAVPDIFAFLAAWFAGCG